MNAEMVRALEVIRALLDLLDRKWLQLSMRESDVQVVDDARAFVRDNS